MLCPAAIMAASSSEEADRLVNLRREIELKVNKMGEPELEKLMELMNDVAISSSGEEDEIMLSTDPQEMARMVEALKTKIQGKGYTKVTDVCRRMVTDKVIPNARGKAGHHKAGDWALERTDCSPGFIVTCRAFLEATEKGDLSQLDKDQLCDKQVPGPWLTEETN